MRDEIIAEAEYQIRRLRNHPSIVLWCGCNEDVYSWSYPRAVATADARPTPASMPCPMTPGSVNRLRDDPQIYSMILRGLVGKLGLGVPYIESSPQSHEDFGNHAQLGQLPHLLLEVRAL